MAGRAGLGKAAAGYGSTGAQARRDLQRRFDSVMKRLLCGGGVERARILVLRLRKCNHKGQNSSVSTSSAAYMPISSVSSSGCMRCSAPQMCTTIIIPATAMMTWKV